MAEAATNTIITTRVLTKHEIVARAAAASRSHGETGRHLALPTEITKQACGTERTRQELIESCSVPQL
jgi:hypothetical protein